MDNVENIKNELKIVRDELFQLRLKQSLSKDEFTLNKLKDEEIVIIKKLKKLTNEKVSYESKRIKK